MELPLMHIACFVISALHVRFFRGRSMGILRVTVSTAVLGLAAFSFSSSSNAVPILCGDIAANHMYLDTGAASSCLAAATEASDLVDIGPVAFKLRGDGGKFALDWGLWDHWTNVAIGFSFSTGQASNWFFYELQPHTTSGSWSFVDALGDHSGLSSLRLYGRPAGVPEPATLVLFSIGMLGVVLLRSLRVAPVQSSFVVGER